MSPLRHALITAVGLLLACSAGAQTVLFDLDTGTPALFAGQGVPLDQTAGGLTAHFSSPDGVVFSIQTDSTAGLHLSQFSGNYLYPNDMNRNRLDISFAQPVTDITLTFATTDFHDPGAGAPSSIQLSAYQVTTAATLVGSTTTAGAFIAGDTIPQGVLTFNAGGASFNMVRLVVPYMPGGTTGFLVDNIVVTPAAVSTALSSLTLSPTTVAGSLNVTGKVTLVSPAPSGGTVVALGNTNPAATVPASVTVPAGLTSATFPITTSAVTASAAGYVTATYSGVSKVVKLTVRPISVKALSLSPSTVAGGNASTGKVTLEAPAAPGNIVVALTSSSTVAAVPASITIAAGQSTGTFTATTQQVTVKTSSSIKAAANGLYKTATLTVRTPGVVGLALAPTSVLGGANSTGTVTLDGLAPAGGQVVTLTSSKPAAATVPASITIPQGQKVGTFTATSLPVSANTSTSLKASASGLYKAATLAVKAPGVASLVLSPLTVRGGSPSTGTVTLTGPAGPTGAIVTLTSSSTLVATVPATIVVAPGQSTGTFSVATLAVTANKLVTIKAATNATSKSVVLTVTP